MLRVGLGAGTLVLMPGARRAHVDRADLPRFARLGLIWMAIPLVMHEHVHGLAYVGAAFILAGAFLTARAGR